MNLSVSVKKEVEVATAETSPWIVLITLIIGTLLIGLDRTVVGLALPAIIS